MTEPKDYTSVEGGAWLPWTAGVVDGRALKKRSKTAVVVNSISVHSLRFDGREWDCINGWRDVKACAECGQVTGHYDDCSVGLGVPSAAQAYALRVWAGQSNEALRPWRIERVKQALEGQGMSMDGVILP